MLGLLAEGRIERLLAGELWVVPEYADYQEDDQGGDGDRNPRSEPIRAERARHINATRIIWVS
jgi:hypothetical protein